MTKTKGGAVLTRFPVAPDSFAEHGVAGPLTLFSPDDARIILARLRGAKDRPAWLKGRAAQSADWYSLASDPQVLDVVEALLGPDIMLWGASLVKRLPGQTHPWHTDIETSAPESGTVTVWIGLSNTSRESSLMLVTRSHNLGMTIQQRARNAGKARVDVTGEHALEWAREMDQRARMVQFEMDDGDAIFFDGRLWHGSHNARQDGVRFAVLLQYAVPSRAIHIADLSVLDFPFHFMQEPRPPCMMVRGSDNFRVNRIVAPPPVFRGQ